MTALRNSAVAVEFQRRYNIRNFPTLAGFSELKRVCATVREFLADVESISAKDKRHVAEDFYLWIFHFFDESSAFAF